MANEPPIEAAARELREELGLSVEIGALLCVDWIRAPRALGRHPRLRLRRRHLSTARIDALHITDDELSGFRFCTLNEAAELLRPSVWQRAVDAPGCARDRQGLR